jgi:hypothetical protein
MKKVVVTLSRLIKRAKKVILSDAMINGGAVELVKNRAPGLVFKNEFKKFEGTPAVRMRDEHDFLQALRPLQHKATLSLRLRLLQCGHQILPCLSGGRDGQ